MKIIHNDEFTYALRRVLKDLDNPSQFKMVTGPGRSGAIAAVYTSYILGIPFVPFGMNGLHRVLIVDTASQSGKTMRKSLRRYASFDPHWIHIYNEPPRVGFWYERH